MPDRRLTSAFRGVAEAALPDDVLSQERALRGVLNDDATIRLEALVQTLPWTVRDGIIPGEVETGANQLAFPMPQGAVLRHIAMSARVGPSGGPFGVTITGGDRTESLSIPAGQTANATGVTIPVAPGAWIRINVTAANSAEDVSVSIHYSAGTGER